MYEVVPNSDSKSPSAGTAGINAANLCKGASSACLSLFSNAQACQTGDWKFESSPKKIWHSTNTVYFKSLHFLRATCLWKLPLLWTALPSQHAALCFPEHETTANSVDEMHDVFICDAAVIFPSTRYTNLQGSHKTNSKTDWWLNMRKQELHNQRRKSAPVKLLWPLPQPCVRNKWSL